MRHYCDDCTAGVDHDGDEYCCGGDARCDAVEAEPDCVPGLDHSWTRQGMGGCDTNPGVWSLGGTTYAFRARCRYCGTVRKDLSRGVQRNPGECDSTRYAEGEPDSGAADTALRRERRLARRRRRYRERAVEALP